MKAIHILGHSPSLQIKNLHDGIYYGWGPRFSRELKKRYKIDIECWFFEKTKKHYEEFDDIHIKDIKYRIFPCKPSLGFGHEISMSLIRGLEKLSKEEDFIIHLHTAYSYNNYLICKKFSNFPIVLQQHGESPPTKIIEKKKIFTIFYPLLLIDQNIEKKAFKNIEQFFVLSKAYKDYLEGFVNGKVKIQQMGADFSLFKPISKIKARKKLDWDLDKKIILYIGRFFKLKGLDILLNSFKKLGEDYELAAVGGYKNEEFYKELKKTKNVKTIEHIPHKYFEKMFPLLYNAADVFVLPSSKFHNKWCGLDVPMLESLACNTPVIAPSLDRFLPKDRNKIGVLLKDSLVYTLKTFFAKKRKYKCREITRKYYSWDIIAKNTIGVYKKLFNKYF